ncbi:hypothetical protein L2X67_22215 [Enterobacter ludwigii]|nr:hypothetical protein [Enterobacter ludwigii]
MPDEHVALRWGGQYGSFGEVRHQSEGLSRLVPRTMMAQQLLRYVGLEVWLKEQGLM